MSGSNYHWQQGRHQVQQNLGPQNDPGQDFRAREAEAAGRHAAEQERQRQQQQQASGRK